MTEVIRGLDLGLGLELDSQLDPVSVANLASYVVKNMFEVKPNRRPKIQVEGHLFGFPVGQSGESYENRTRLRLSKAPVLGHLVISKLHDNSLGLDAKLKNEYLKDGSARLEISGFGEISFERAEVYKKYEEVMASLDLGDVWITTSIAPGNQVFMKTELGLPLD